MGTEIGNPPQLALAGASFNFLAESPFINIDLHFRQIGGIGGGSGELRLHRGGVGKKRIVCHGGGGSGRDGASGEQHGFRRGGGRSNHGDFFVMSRPP